MAEAVKPDSVMHGLLEGLLGETKNKLVRSAAASSSALDKIADIITDGEITRERQERESQASLDDTKDEIANAAKKARDDHLQDEANQRADLGKQDKIIAISNAIKDKNTFLGGATSKLTDSIKDDFKTMGAQFSMITEAPGFKTLIAVVKFVGVILSTVILKALYTLIDKFGKVDAKTGKKSGFLGKEIAKDKDGKVDVKATTKNFKEKLNPFSDRNKERRIDKAVMKDSKKGYVSKSGKVFGKDTTQGKMIKAAGGKKATGIQTFKSNVSGMAKNLSKSISKGFSKGLTKSIGKFKNAMSGLAKGLKFMAKGFARIAKALVKVAMRLFVQVGIFLAGMAMAVIGFIMANLPIILIIAALVLLAVGLYFLGKYISDNWVVIKEKISIAVDQIKIWGSVASNFISNLGKTIWLKIKSVFVSIVEGVQNFANLIIEGINSKIPGERYDLEPLDIGAGRMRKELDQEKAAFEIKKAGQSEEIAERQKGLDDRKVALKDGSFLKQQTIVANNTNNNSNTAQIIPANTTPADSYAGGMAIGQQ